jgi:hypothetical protein
MGWVVNSTNRAKWKFKVPTLRKVALTAPYMHNGTFATFEEVMDLNNSLCGWFFSKLRIHFVLWQKLNLIRKKVEKSSMSDEDLKI